MSTASKSDRTTHAPGPWRILDRDGICYHVISADASFQTGCIAFDGQGFANAQLIAAAPELLEALRGIIEIGKRNMENPKYDGYFKFAEAALAKAEGRS